MDAAVPAPEPFSLTKTVRSEELPDLARLLRHFQQFGTTDVYQFDVILDANVIMPELRWAALKRRNPAARSNLHELLECATVRSYAPTFLKEEVAANLPEIAAAENIPIEKMQPQ